MGSYPDMDHKDPLVFNLAEVDENLYHGIMVFPAYRLRKRGGRRFQDPFSVHFVVLFGRESNKPMFWNVTTVDVLDFTSTKALQSATISMTDRIFAAAHADSDAAGCMPKRDPGLATAIHKSGEAFVQMDNRWYNFRSAGLEETAFDTHINLVMLGLEKKD